MHPGPSTLPVQAQYQPRTASYAQRPPRAAADGLATAWSVVAVDGARQWRRRLAAASMYRLLARERRPAVAAQAVEHRRRVLDRRLAANTTGAGCGTASAATGGSSALAAGNGALASAANAKTAPVHTQHGVSVGLAVVALLGCVRRRAEARWQAESARPRKAARRAWGRRRALVSAGARRHRRRRRGEDEAEHDVGRHRSFFGSSCQTPACRRTPRRTPQDCWEAMNVVGARRARRPAPRTRARSGDERRSEGASLPAEWNARPRRVLELLGQGGGGR